MLFKNRLSLFCAVIAILFCAFPFILLSCSDSNIPAIIPFPQTTAEEPLSEPESQPVSPETPISNPEPQTPSPSMPEDILEPDTPVGPVSITFVSGGNITVSMNGSTFTATPSIQGTYTYEWFLQGVQQSSTTNTCTIQASSLLSGFYELIVKANCSNGINYVSCYQLAIE